MNTHADKTQENKSQSVANELSQKQNGSESTFQFVDNRPEAIAQRKLQEMVNYRSRVSQLSSFQDMANNSPQAKQAAPLRAKADNHTAQKQQPMDGVVIQRESSYDGLVPDHDNYGDSYIQGDGSTSAEFTYHHIIPENKLIKVRKELEAIDTHGDETSNRDNLTVEKTGLITSAKQGWMNTRINNFTTQINNKYKSYGIVVTEVEVGNLMNGQPETIAHLFLPFVALIKTKAKAAFEERSNAFSEVLEASVKKEEIQMQIKANPAQGILALLADQLDHNFFDFPALVQAAMVGVNADNPKIHENVSLGTLRRKLLPLIEAAKWNFATYYQTNCQSLYVDSTASDLNLKKILQQYALPHDPDEHLTHAVQWNPGNVHRGPASDKRISKGKAGFKELFDDGGDDFEKAAVNLIHINHYTRLVTLNTDIDAFLALPKTTDKARPNQAKVNAATALIQQMRAIQAYGLTQFKNANWEPHGQDKMRLKEDHGKVTAAEQTLGVNFVR